MAKLYTLTFFFLFVVVTCFAGNPQNEQRDSVYYSDANITISYTVNRCTDHINGKNQFNVILTIKNDGSSPKEVSYYIEKQFKNYCLGCSDPEQQKVHNYTIPAGTSITGECFEVASGLSFLSGMDLPGAKSKLQSFELRNLQIQTP